MTLRNSCKTSCLPKATRLLRRESPNCNAIDDELTAAVFIFNSLFSSPISLDFEARSVNLRPGSASCWDRVQPLE